MRRAAGRSLARASSAARASPRSQSIVRAGGDRAGFMRRWPDQPRRCVGENRPPRREGLNTLASPQRVENLWRMVLQELEQLLGDAVAALADAHSCAADACVPEGDGAHRELGGQNALPDD